MTRTPRLVAPFSSLLFCDVVFVRDDAERGPGEQVATDDHVNAYPTFLVLDETGTIALPWVDQAGRRVTRCFTQLAGGAALLDGVKPISPLLSANFEKSIGATRSPRQ